MIDLKVYGDFDEDKHQYCDALYWFTPRTSKLAPKARLGDHKEGLGAAAGARREHKGASNQQLGFTSGSLFIRLLTLVSGKV